MKRFYFKKRHVLKRKNTPKIQVNSNKIRKSISEFLNFQKMTTHLALLRGINVYGHNMIKMEALKTTLEAIGFQNVQTYSQSGNVFVENEEKKIEQMTVFVNSQFLAQQSPAVGIDAFEVFDGGFQEVLLHSLDTDDADLIRKDTDKNGFLI